MEFGNEVRIWPIQYCKILGAIFEEEMVFRRLNSCKKAPNIS
jgi:hypothetical protein